MLAGAGFGDDALLAHAPGQKNLTHGVIDFVRPGVKQVFPLEIHFRSAQFAREPFREVQWRWPAAEFAQVIIQLALKLGILLRAEVFRLELLQRVHQRLGDESPAVRPKAAFGVGQVSGSDGAHNSA